MIRYEDPVIRPPAEAGSLIVQATVGCSHNRCAFCFTYSGKRFRVRPHDELVAEIDWAAERMGPVRRVFLGDGDGMTLSTDRLLRLLEALYERLPMLRRVSVYAAPQNFRSKSVADLGRLRDAGLTQVYVGFESGDDEVLERVCKGVDHDEMVELCLRPQRAGIKLSAMVVLGLGGPRLSRRHAEESARLLDEIKPRFASALTLMLEPGSDRYAREFGDPEWRLLDPLEMIRELRWLIEAVEADGIIFRSNHASNYLALEGVFQKSKRRMLGEVDAVLGDAELHRVRPDYMRGL